MDATCAGCAATARADRSRSRRRLLIPSEICFRSVPEAAALQTQHKADRAGPEVRRSEKAQRIQPIFKMKTLSKREKNRNCLTSQFYISMAEAHKTKEKNTEFEQVNKVRQAKLCLVVWDLRATTSCSDPGLTPACGPLLHVIPYFSLSAFV